MFKRLVTIYRKRSSVQSATKGSDEVIFNKRLEVNWANYNKFNDRFGLKCIFSIIGDKLQKLFFD